MRIATVLKDGVRKAGVVEGDQIFITDVAGADAAIGLTSDLRKMPGRWLARSKVTFDAVLRPPVLLCTGHNYRDHVEEKVVIRPEKAKGLEFFMKASQTIAAPGEGLFFDPVVSTKLDQETELGFVIGKGGRHIPKERALEHVFGYLVVNDVTARDRQVKKRADGSFAMELGTAKNFEGSTQLSTELVTRDEIPDPQALALSTKVNGEQRQFSNTSLMINTVADVIAHFSSLLYLHPGCVISTGTPAGTGWGQDRDLGGSGRIPAQCKPGAYLQPGDHVISEIEKIGTLTFTVHAPV